MTEDRNDPAEIEPEAGGDLEAAARELVSLLAGAAVDANDRSRFAELAAAIARYWAKERAEPGSGDSALSAVGLLAATVEARRRLRRDRGVANLIFSAAELAVRVGKALI